MKPDDWAEADQALEGFRKDVDALIAKHFQAVGATTEYQATIYHYTNVKGALGILESGQLWFTERVHLNDPVEIRYGLGVAHRLFGVAMRDRGGAIPVNAASHLKAEHDVNLDTFGFWISCFSLDGDDLAQWRNYADDGRGLCLGFSTTNFDLNEMAEHIPNRLRFPVNYNENDLRKNLQTYIDIGLDVLEKANLPARESYYQPYGKALYYERDFLRILNDGFYANSLLFKHAAYSHEQEYRLLVSGFRDKIFACGHHHLRERSGEIVGYLSIPIPRWKEQGVLTHIRLGPAAPDQLADQFRMALMTLGLPTPKIDKSRIPYRPTRGVS
jgi:hypothetical protein